MEPSSRFSRDRSTIFDCIISRKKVADYTIFYLAEVGNLYTVARLDIVESFLRRGAKGISLCEVKTVYEKG